MQQLWSLTAVIALSFALGACGSQVAPKPAKSVTPQARSQMTPRKKTSPEERSPDQRNLVAPPPAYGNKVVLQPPSESAERG